MVGQSRMDGFNRNLARIAAEQAFEAVGSIQGVGCDALELGSDARLAHQMIGMRDQPAVGIKVGAVVGRRLDVDDLSVGMTEQKIRGTAAIGLHDGEQSLVESPGIQDFLATDVERFAEPVGAVARGHQSVDA